MTDTLVKWLDRLAILAILAATWVILFSTGCGVIPWMPITDTPPVAYARLAVQAKYDVDLSDTNVLATESDQTLGIVCRTREPIWGCAISEWTIAVRYSESDQQNCQSAMHEYIHLASIRKNNDWDYGHSLMNYLDFVSETCAIWDNQGAQHD